MSPEQVRGLDLDQRTDIWAYGCVLYEMLSGQKAFEGATTSDRMAATLTREPDWARLAEDTPARTRDLVHRCLEKSSEKRPQSMPDILEALSGLDEEGTDSPETGLGWRRYGLGAAAVLMGAVLVIAWLGLRGGEEEKRESASPQRDGAREPFSSGTKLSQLTTRKGVEEFPAWSPNGRQFAFSAEVGKGPKNFSQGLRHG